MKRQQGLKTFAFSLLVLTSLLTACNKSQVSTPSTSAIAASTNTSPSEQKSQDASKTRKETLPKSTSKKQAQKPGKIIGGAIDCDNDGKQNDSRVDYNGDGIPDECVIGSSSEQEKVSEITSAGEEEIEPATSEAIFDSQIKYLEEMTEGCDEATKTEAGVNYNICTINDKPVKASEALLEAGDGLGFWFENNKVVAIRYFHTGDILFFNDGKLTVKFSDDKQVQDTFTDEERQHAEDLAKDGYRKIFQVFAVEAN